MKISARNQLQGVVKSVTEGAVNGIVTIEIAAEKQISATISMSSIKELGLAEGKEAYAIIKSTEVMIADSTQKISARNQLRRRGKRYCKGRNRSGGHSIFYNLHERDQGIGHLRRQGSDGGCKGDFRYDRYRVGG